MRNPPAVIDLPWVLDDALILVAWFLCMLSHWLTNPRCREHPRLCTHDFDEIRTLWDGEP